MKLLTCDWTPQAREENITVDNVPMTEGEHRVNERVDWVFITQKTSLYFKTQVTLYSSYLILKKKKKEPQLLIYMSHLMD